MAKLKNIKEQLYFSTSNKKIVKLITIFLNTIYGEYLESNTNIEKQLSDTDYVIYMKKVANNDIKRHDIMLYRSLYLKENCIITNKSKNTNITNSNITNSNNNTNTNFSNTNSVNQKLPKITSPTKNIRSIFNYVNSRARNNTFAKSSHATRNNKFAKSSHATRNNIFAKSSHAPQNLELTSENIRKSSNSVIIDIQDDKNIDDEKSLDYSQFAPSSRETGDRSFVGSIGSLLDSENSYSNISNNTLSKKYINEVSKKNINEVNLKVKILAARYIQNIWKKYKKKTIQ